VERGELESGLEIISITRNVEHFGSVTIQNLHDTFRRVNAQIELLVPAVAALCQIVQPRQVDVSIEVKGHHQALHSCRSGTHSQEVAFCVPLIPIHDLDVHHLLLDVQVAYYLVYGDYAMVVFGV